MFLYNSRASSSVVSAPTLLSMMSPYWLRHRYVDIAPFDLDGSRNSSVFVNSLFNAPGKRTLCFVSYGARASNNHGILFSIGSRSNASALPCRCSHRPRGIVWCGQSLKSQSACRIAERHFVVYILPVRGPVWGFGASGEEGGRLFCLSRSVSKPNPRFVMSGRAGQDSGESEAKAKATGTC